jgi:dTDP-4-dehydrorhamnose reductase
MRVLVTGAKGQLGRDLVKLLSNGIAVPDVKHDAGGAEHGLQDDKHDAPGAEHGLQGVKHDALGAKHGLQDVKHDAPGATFEVLGADRSVLDITNEAQCRAVMESFRPDAVIHTAAYTAVDKAESDEDEAYRINAVGTRNVAVAAESVDAKLICVSTDYVFDGTAHSPYKEYDDTRPIGVYGKSKRAGEILVQGLSSKFFIVRTSWVFGVYGNNFVKTMLKLGADKDRLTVVHDQIGSPTYTVDLSRFLAELIQTERYGIYHASNSGVCSWYEFARAIFEESGLKVQVDPCTTDQFPRPAPRPAYSVMDHQSIRTNGFADLQHWREALKDFLQELNEAAHEAN